MNPGELVVDPAAYCVLRGECEKIIDTRKRMPDFVFKRSFAKYFAIEHAHIYKREFGELLRKLSSVFADASVNYMTIDPDPVDYYYKHLSFFGLATFEPATLMERYAPTMSRDGNVDSFRFRGGDVGVFWGSSLRWAVSCDRISWELAVIAVPENVDVPAMSGFRCMNTSGVSDYIKSQYSTNTSVASTFLSKFSANYPAPS